MKENSHGSGAYTYPPSPEPSENMPPYRVFMIGDGYPPGCSGQDEDSLHDAMTKIATVVNAKATGYTICMIKNSLPNLFTQCASQNFPPDAVIVKSGATDSAVNPFTPDRFADNCMTRYREDLEDTIKAIQQEWQSDRVIVVAPPPLVPELWYQHQLRNHTKAEDGGSEPSRHETFEQAKRYNDQCSFARYTLSHTGVLVFDSSDAWDQVTVDYAGPWPGDVSYRDSLDSEACGYGPVNTSVVRLIIHRVVRGGHSTDQAELHEDCASPVTIKLPDWTQWVGTGTTHTDPGVLEPDAK